MAGLVLVGTAGLGPVDEDRGTGGVGREDQNELSGTPGVDDDNDDDEEGDSGLFVGLGGSCGEDDDGGVGVR